MSGQQDQFNPRSTDAMFATILTRLDQQDKTATDRHDEQQRAMEAVLAEQKRTNGRVTALEHFKTALKSKVTAVSFCISCAVGFGAWCLERIFG